METKNISCIKESLYSVDLNKDGKHIEICSSLSFDTAIQFALFIHRHDPNPHKLIIFNDKKEYEKIFERF